MNLQPNRSSVADVRDVMKKDRATVSQTMQTPSDLLAKELKVRRQDRYGPRRRSGGRSQIHKYKPAAIVRWPIKAPIRRGFNCRPRFIFVRNFKAAAPTDCSASTIAAAARISQQPILSAAAAAMLADAEQVCRTKVMETQPAAAIPRSSPGSPKITASPDPRPAGGASLSKYNYQNIKDRGRSLSDRVASGADAGSPTESPDVNTLRRVKDPVATVGLSGDRTIYGPGGADGSPAPSSTTGLDDRPSGLGSYTSPATLPRMSHFDTRLDRHSSQTPINDPAARTYDPARGGY